MVARFAKLPRSTGTDSSTNLPVQLPLPLSAAQAQTIREKVLSVLTGDPVSGVIVAARAGLEYKQTIDALNILFNMERVERVGQKQTARWRTLQPASAAPRVRDPFVDIPFLRRRATEQQATSRAFLRA